MKKIFVGLLIALGCIGLVAGAVYLYYSNQITAQINANRGLDLRYTDVQSNTAGNYSWTPTDIDADMYGGEWLAFDANLTNKANHTFTGMNYQIEIINWATLNNNDLFLEYTDGSGTTNMTLCNTDAYHLYGYVPVGFDVNPISENAFHVMMQLNESVGPGTYYVTTEVIKDTGRAC